MAGLAERARAAARKEQDLDLDFSRASVEALERILAALHRRHRANPIPETELGDAVNLWGAYLGETIRRHKPGAWRCDSTVGGKGSLPLVHGAGEEAFPVAWTYRRIVNGEEDNVWRKFQVLYPHDQPAPGGRG